MIRLLSLVLSFSLLCGCASKKYSVYEEIGGLTKIELIADNFIREIEFNKTILAYFKDSKISRFREKFIEHLCSVTGGPCKYTGDSMVAVHEGMNITEKDFNQTVDLLISAMTDAGLSHRTQNKVLAILAPMRDEIYKR